MTYRIVLTPTALRMLGEIGDRRLTEMIGNRIEGLARNPELSGKALTGELGGFRSLRAAGQRYRVIYRVDRAKGRVVVHAVGIRREGSREDIYALAERLVRLGLAGSGK